MDWLNYHHLLYFWTVAREGGVARAAKKLLLAPPTISGQIRALERTLGERLFRRAGRGLQLTEQGRVVLRYAEEIFSLGRELLETVKGKGGGRPVRLVVGIANVVPKLVVRRLLEPALRSPQPLRLVCLEDRPERLLAELSIHGLDMVLTDAPVLPGAAVRVYNHLLGESAVAFYAGADLARRIARGFPKSLDGAPMLLPAEGTALRRSLEPWFDACGVRPRIVAEFEDTALMKTFGQAGAALFPAPRVVEQELETQFGAVRAGEADGVRERFYAITPERRIKHPAVVAISSAARERFGSSPS